MLREPDDLPALAGHLTPRRRRPPSFYTMKSYSLASATTTPVCDPARRTRTGRSYLHRDSRLLRVLLLARLAPHRPAAESDPVLRPAAGKRETLFLIPRIDPSLYFVLHSRAPPARSALCFYTYGHTRIHGSPTGNETIRVNAANRPLPRFLGTVFR